MKQLLVLFALLSFSCGVLELDHGKLKGRNGQELRATYPLVIVHSEIDTWAGQWWNDQLNHEVFVDRASSNFEWVTINIDDLEPNVWGEAALDYNEAGLIYRCEVRIERTASGSWRQRVIRHELGHCMGLDDDAISLDLDSIMSPLVGENVTSKDVELILADIEL